MHANKKSHQPFDFPFTVSTANHLTSNQEDPLVELSSNRTLKAAFSAKTLAEFWISVKREYPWPRELGVMRVLQHPLTAREFKI